MAVGRDSHAAPAVALRRVLPADLPILFEHQHDPVATELAQFPARDHAAFMAHWTTILANPRVTARTVLADEVVVGNIGSFDYEGRREVGYWLGRAFWGLGIATSALTAFLALDRSRPLHAAVAHGNAGSMRVLEKCGFDRCGEQPEVAEFVLLS